MRATAADYRCLAYIRENDVDLHHTWRPIAIFPLVPGAWSAFVGSLSTLMSSEAPSSFRVMCLMLTLVRGTASLALQRNLCTVRLIIHFTTSLRYWVCFSHARINRGYSCKWYQTIDLELRNIRLLSAPSTAILGWTLVLPLRVRPQPRSKPEPHQFVLKHNQNSKDSLRTYLLVSLFPRGLQKSPFQHSDTTFPSPGRD